MRVSLYPGEKKLSSFFRFRFYFIFLFLGLLVCINANAKTVIIGTGSGSVIQNGMGTLVAGDTLAIAAGTYNGGGQFSNLSNITIINSGGVVTFTGTVDWGNNTNMVNINFTGNGSAGNFYGFVFNGSGNYGAGPLGFSSGDAFRITAPHTESVIWQYISFQNLTANAFNNGFDTYNYYVGTTASLKWYKITIANCRIDNSYQFYQGDFGIMKSNNNENMCDSVDMHNIIVTQITNNGGVVTGGCITHFNFYNWNITYSGYNTQSGDVGVFDVEGNGRIHNNYMHGGRGYLARIFGCSAKPNIDDLWFYNNIILATSNYSGGDLRNDTTYYGQANPYYQRLGEIHVLFNTVGNKGNDEGYIAPVVVIDALNQGATAEVRNNIGFNLNTPNLPQAGIVGSFVSGWPTSSDTSNNMYYTAAAIMSVLADTSTSCAVKAGSPVIGAGLSISNIITDFAGKGRPNPPTIGAMEYSGTASSVLANAGNSQTITLPLDSVTLSGSASTVVNSTISSYLWSEISGPNTATFSSTNKVSGTAGNLIAGTYVFGLKVKDANNDSSAATVTITVNAANQPPTVSAGSNQTITLPTSSVNLTGSATDILGISSYLWTEVSGPNTASLGSSSLINTSASGLIAGTYVFQLKVVDIVSLFSTATVTITVNAAANQPPVVNAGTAQTITLPTSSVTLIGSATDATGTIKTYTWTQSSGPNTASITNASSSSTTVTGLAAGTYVFQLKATDNNSLSGTATVTITVNAAPNQPPVVNAGTAQTITLPTSSVTLTGSATDATGTIKTYAWTQSSGPTTASITNASSSSTTVTGLAAGTYVFQLKATDNNSLSGTATVTITVNAAPNQPPVVNAGTAQTITLPVNSVTLNGSATDATGTIKTYAWTQSSGPNTASITSASSASTTVTGLIAGTYVFQLKATDNNSLSGTATVTITVNPAPNQPPIANAGANQTITLPTNSVTIDGSASKDPDGVIVSFSWTKISGPTQGTIASPTNVTSIVNNLVQGTYTLKLTVTDNGGASSSDTITIVVNPSPNQPPVANAGSSKTITLPVNSTTLSGTQSYDPDGTIASYSWSQVSGPSTSTITGGTTGTPTVSALIAGTYVYQLTVKDNQGASSSTQVKVIVNPAVNQPPIANAGNNQTITLPTNSITLDGSASKDPDGSIVSFNWKEVSGPAQGTIVNANNVTTSVNSLVQGTYVFKLTVTDNSGATGNDSVTIMVNPAPNQPPVANAGSSKTITLPVNSTTLSGTQSYDPDGTIASYSWVEISGPSAATVSGATTATLNVSGLLAGQYIFQLNVTDNSGATSSAQANITVNAAANVNPISNAGANQTITLPLDSVNVDGSASVAPSGTIVSFAWAQVSGPSQATIANSTIAATLINNLAQGVYTFQLTVTDNNGNSSSDTLTITVKAAVNKAPVANAGASKTIVLPLDSATLDGTKSYDPDGTIVSYSWTEISGPSTATISGANTATPTVSALVAGRYFFQLSVTDNSGATSKTAINVTVILGLNQPPTANAGANQIITLPVDSVTVNGNASVDADGTITAYIWTQVSGPAQSTIVNSSSVSTTIDNLAQGTYVFKLTVTDNRGAKTSDTLTVTVNAAANQPPVANAGTSKTITLPVDSTTLDGTKSSDPDGTIASYSWSEVSGPSTATIVGSSTATPTVSGLVQGEYVFQLTVTDNSGATNTNASQVKITVLAAANQAPIANAGVNQSITMPTTTVSLDGSQSYDPDGTIASYSWTRVSGTGAVTINNSNSAKPTVTGLQAGQYTFKLTVADNRGATASAQVSVTVNAAVVVNQAPVANAGSNQTITLPLDSVTLNGSKSSDPDGSIAYYSWSEASGSSGINISNPNTVSPEITGLSAGQYVFQLVVTDNKGANDTATVTITVNNAQAVVVNKPPVANAGKDTTIALPSDSAVLNGSASTAPAGNIVSYQWNQISGPNTSIIMSSGSDSTGVTGLIVGTYTFELTITDNLGQTSTDTVHVIVQNNLRTSATQSSMLLYPNPTTSNITLQVNSTATGTMMVYIYGIRGNIVMVKEFSKPSSYLSTTVNTSLLYGGTYTMQVVINKKTVMVGKFVKQ
jgi:chitodextrinase